MNDFERALRETLRYEGGYVWHKDDPGGETNFGVTAATYSAYRRAHNLPQQSVRHITQAELRDIYKTGFWDTVTQGRTWPLDAVLFDAGVNHGPNTALWLLDEVRSRVQPNDPRRMLKLALLVCDRRERFYHFLVQRRPSLGVFLTGWLRRVNEQRAICRQPGSTYSLAPDAPLMAASPELFTPRTPDDYNPATAGDTNWTPSPDALSGIDQ